MRRLIDGVKVLFCYLSPLPCVPAIGKLEDADCLILQAYARNDIKDEELGGVIGGIRRLGFTKDFQIFDELLRQGFRTGKPNLKLARFSMRISDFLGGVPVIAQWEVVLSIYQLNPMWYFDHIERIECIWPPDEGYFATWHVKIFSRYYMRQRGLKRPLEVAHPAMVARALAILWKLGVDAIVLPVSIFSFPEHELWEFDENSVQPWTVRFGVRTIDPRKFLTHNWVVRETIGRWFHHPVKRWVSFVPPSK